MGMVITSYTMYNMNKSLIEMDGTVSSFSFLDIRLLISGGRGHTLLSIKNNRSQIVCIRSEHL